MMQHLTTYKKWIFLIALLITLGIATPVLADYLGPNRTVTQTVSVCKVVLYECKLIDGKYKDHSVDDWSCSNESKPWEAYDSNGSCNVSNVGRKHWEREDKTQTVTTYPAATISGSIQNCTVQNGWCVTSPQLALNANEPVSGYNITLIEGTRNGTSFSCQPGETNCSVPLSEGSNNFNYWTLSSWGDSSLMGSSAAKVDTVAPNVSADISGVSGTNGWYVSPTTVTATGSDATSGVASALLSLDPSANPPLWQPSVTVGEGIYNNIAVQVTDNAGNVSNATITLSVDTTTPTINLSVNGTAGNNGWFKSVVQVSATPSDATSGVATLEASADGAAYQTYTTPISFSDGHHTLRFKAVDQAGNATETPVQDFYIDTQAPTVELPRSWPFDKNVDYTAQDTVSGLAALRVVIEDEDEKFKKVTWDEPVTGLGTFTDNIHWDGIFKDKTKAPPGTYLVWVKVSDRAGNERFQLGKAIVPEPNYAWLLPQPGGLRLSKPNAIAPTEAAVVPSPVPPAELTEPESLLPVTSPSTSFGGGATQPGEAAGLSLSKPTQRSVLLATGTAGASASTSSGILWGAAAAAAIGAATAYALDATRKRKEAEEAQAAQARAQAGHAGQPLTKEEIKEAKAKRAEAHDQKVQDRYERQAWANPAKEKELLRQQVERDAAYQAWLQQQKNTPPPMPSGISPEAQQAFLHGGASAQQWVINNATGLQQTYVKQQEQQKEAARAQEEKKKAEEERAGRVEQLRTLSTFNAEKNKNQTIITAAPSACVALPEKPWWQKMGDWVSPKISYAVDAFTAAKSAWALKDLKFTPLDSGLVSVSAKNLPKGARLDYFKEVVQPELSFKPGAYTASNVGSIVKDGLVESAKKTWVTAGVVSLAVNAYNYGKDATSWGDFTNKTLKNQEFWVSTVVDTGVAVVVGAVAAVAATALLSATAPVWGTVLVAAALGVGIGWGLDKLGVPKLLKKAGNWLVDSLGF